MFAISILLISGIVSAADPGFVVDVFPGSAEFPRNGEGSIIELTDGALLFVNTRFYGGSADAAGADLVCVRSTDGGRTWSNPEVAQKNVGVRNVMSASLRRLTDHKTSDGKHESGPIGFFYLVKNGDADLKVYVRVSNDEANTWGGPVCVTDRPGYHVMNNDRVLRTSKGRLLCPVAWTPDSTKTNHYRSLCFISDDAGATWRAGKGDVDVARRGAMEPEVIEKKDGSIFMLVRTQLGRNWCAISTDGGDTWSTPEAFGPPSPEGPSTLRPIPGTDDWLLIYNHNFVEGADHGGNRSPLTAAISPDEGKTWIHRHDIETNPEFNYRYTSLIFVDGRAVLSYFFKAPDNPYDHTRFRSIPIEWFYSE